MPPGWGPSKWDQISAGGNRQVKPYVEKPNREKSEGAKPAEAPSILDDLGNTSVGKQIKETVEAADKLVTNVTTTVKDFLGIGEKKYDTGEGDATAGPGSSPRAGRGADHQRRHHPLRRRCWWSSEHRRRRDQGRQARPRDDPSPEGDHGGVVGTGTTPLAPPGSEISKPVDPTVVYGGGHDPTPGSGAGSEGQPSDGLTPGSAAATGVAASTDASAQSMTTVGSGSSGGGIQSVVPDDLTGVAVTPMADTATTGIIIPDVNRAADDGIIIPDVDHTLDHEAVDQQMVDASPQQAATAMDPVADAMATAELPTHQVPVDALPGVTVEEGFGPGQTTEALLDGD